MSVSYKRLEEVCEILDAQRVPITAKDRKAGKYPYYGANGLQDHISDYIFDDELVLLAEDGGNFGSKDRPIAYRVSGKCWVNNHAHVLKAKNVIDTDYLCYALMFYNTDGIVNGATRQKLTQSAMRKMIIPYRNIQEQAEIVEKIHRIFDLIDKRKHELNLLDELVKSRFIELFGDPVSNPMGWEETTLKTVCTKITDGEHGSVPRVEKGHPFLNAKHVLKNGSIDWASVSFIDDEVHDKLCRRCNPEENDILMTTTGTIGNIAIVTNSEPFSMDRGITLLKIDREQMDSRFIACLLRFDGIQALMQANVHASAIGHLFLNKVEQIPIILPSLVLQQQFAAFVAEVDKSKHFSELEVAA